MQPNYAASQLDRFSFFPTCTANFCLPAHPVLFRVFPGLVFFFSVSISRSFSGSASREPFSFYGQQNQISLPLSVTRRSAFRERKKKKKREINHFSILKLPLNPVVLIVPAHGSVANLNMPFYCFGQGVLGVRFSFAHQSSYPALRKTFQKPLPCVLFRLDGPPTTERLVWCPS